MDQMNHSDFLSIFNLESNQGDPISNCLGVELLRVISCRQEFKKVPFTQGLRQDLADVLFYGQRKTTISLILEMLEIFDIFRISKQYMSSQ